MYLFNKNTYLPININKGTGIILLLSDLLRVFLKKTKIALRNHTKIQRDDIALLK